MHIHLDPVGGIAGDMFTAALLDTWPELTSLVISTVQQAGLQSALELARIDHNDGVLTGSQFTVSLKDTESVQNPTSISDSDTDADTESHHSHHHGHSHSHGHGHWSVLRQQLSDSALPAAVKHHAIGIFTELARAEAEVHGKSIDDVAFHEVGNWDSVADIVAAATLIDRLAAESWSVGALPVGHGLVNTAHGELPVPAPATTLLLRGFAFRDDGRSGERVTPTGAAILKYLAPTAHIGTGTHTLQKTGFGFGQRKLPGISNVLRVLAFDCTIGHTPEDSTTDQVGVIQFEIDDQTGEELAATLQHIRAHEHVIDATQTPVFGKKGRMMTAVQILTQPDALTVVAEHCFAQATTLGLRTRIETRHILHRQHTAIDKVRVKLAQRPGGTTAKAEMDDVISAHGNHAARSHARLSAEQAALQTTDNQSNMDHRNTNSNDE